MCRKQLSPQRRCGPTPAPTSRVNQLYRPSRLYAKGRIMGHKRSQRVAKCHTSLIKIEGVEKTDEAKFYLGKRVAY
ncbi:hypothetical protein, partial [Sporisorium scitamineum]